MAARGEPEMAAPRPPELRRRAGELTRPRKKPVARTARNLGSPDHACTTGWPGPASTRAGPRSRCVRDGDDPAGDSRERHSRRGDGLARVGTEGDPAGPARRSRRYCGRPAFPAEQHDGRITRWAPPDDVAVQSQAEGRGWVLSASGGGIWQAPGRASPGWRLVPAGHVRQRAPVADGAGGLQRGWQGPETTCRTIAGRRCRCRPAPATPAGSGWRPWMNRRPLDPQECTHDVTSSVDVRLRRSGGAQASAPKRRRALLSRTRSHLRSL